MNKTAIIQTYDRVIAFVKTETPERQRECVNILVDCWDLTQEGMGYIVGRLVGNNDISTQTGSEDGAK